MNFKELTNIEFKKPYYQELHTFITQEYETKTVFPPKQEIFRALNLCPYEKVKVVIIGQDPYHGYKQANGLSFSVRKGVPVPPSLVNIYQELHDDIGCSIPHHGDLTSWAKQGVLLLNNVLTVLQGRANSHAGKGWEIFTLEVIKALNSREQPMVFILWGKKAQEKLLYINQQKHLVITSSHPSPYSATYGFFGSKPFSRANAFLVKNHIQPIQWEISE